MYRRTTARSATSRLTLAAALSACLVAQSATPAHADTFAEHQRRGAEYLQSQRYTQALVELQAAYALQQRPVLLYYIARCHHNMGQRHMAITYYDRYIVSEPDPAERAVAERHLAALTADSPVEPAVSTEAVGDPAPLRRTERSGPRWGMVAAGATLFTLSYGSALIMGAMGLAGLSTFSSKGADVGLAQAGVGTLMVPLAGPLLSGFIIRTPEWSVPWTLLNLPSQILGIVLLGAGAQRSRTPTAPSLAFLPNVTPGSASFTVAGRF